jgi:hypothetical protein
MIGGRAKRIGDKRIDGDAEEEPHGVEFTKRLGHGEMAFVILYLFEDLKRLLC